MYFFLTATLERFFIALKLAKLSVKSDQGFSKGIQILCSSGHKWGNSVYFSMILLGMYFVGYGFNLINQTGTSAKTQNRRLPIESEAALQTGRTTGSPF